MNMRALKIIGLAVATVGLTLAGGHPGVGLLAHEDHEDEQRPSLLRLPRAAALLAANRAFLGVRVEDAEPGVVVKGVVEDSAAQRAGILEGDLILELSNRTIDDADQLTRALGEYEPGDELELVVQRGGKRESMIVELGEQPTWTLQWDQDRFQNSMKKLQERLKDLRLPRGNLYFHALGSRPKLGVELIDVTPELREHMGGRRDAGVLVGKVLPGMPARESGIEVGDLLLSINGADVKTSGDVIEALGQAEGSSVDIELVRARRTMRIRVVIPESEESEERPLLPRASHDLYLSQPEVQRAIRESARAMAEANRAFEQALATKDRHRLQQQAAAEARRALQQANRLHDSSQDHFRRAIETALEQARQRSRLL